MIILFSSLERDSLHLTRVMNCLDKKNANYKVISYADFPRESASFLLEGGRQTLTVSQSGEKIDLSHVISIWNRRTGAPCPYSELNPEFQKYTKDETAAFLKSLALLSPHIFWLPHPESEQRASKSYQLMMATQVGLTCPSTYIGNDVNLAKDFIQNREVIIKPFNNSYYIKQMRLWEKTVLFFLKRFGRNTLYTKNEWKRTEYVFAKKPDKDSLLSTIQSISYCPVILQEYTPKQLELRITVVGNDVFACAIHSQTSENAKVDWREDLDALKHEAFQLPDEIAEKCVQLTKALGLSFGCIDMILTPAGEYVFLEVNPNGQWLWIEERTGLPIADAIANLLMNPSIYLKGTESSLLKI